MTSTPPSSSLRVLVVGGGIAALETVLALDRLAGDRVRVMLVAPNDEFSLRPLSVLTPFGRGVAPTLPLATFMDEHDGAFCRDAVLSIDPGRRVAICASGAELEYDALVLSPGARPVPAFERGLTFDPLQADALSGVVADLEQGWSHSVAFVVPESVTWPLPLYELAIMTAEQAWTMGVDARLHFVTPEPKPLGVFGVDASIAVGELLTAAGIVFHGSATPAVPRAGRVELGLEGELAVDRIVALPQLEGPRLLGVPADEAGFIPTDDYGRVTGLGDVWAVGDATQQPIKQGGLACQQADAVAAQIAARAGAQVDVERPVLVLRGRLLAGQEDRFLHRPLGTGRSDAERQPLWWPPAKVASRYLAPYLEAKGIAAPAPKAPEPRSGVPVDVLVNWAARGRADVLGLPTLGPTG